MFDITPDDIAQLNDIDLRELVGRLCEAELEGRGISPAAVTWGGNQTATDGGLDVRVALSPAISIEGFIPRRSTGFQVKTPDMPRSEIIAEMRPKSLIRPVIQELADEAGAYVIVSSKGATSDSALRNRNKAMREALIGEGNGEQLHTDFYDRTRLATWVRRFPGLICWVKVKVGRSLVGWRPYGSWTGVAEGTDAEYLLDDKMRLHFGGERNSIPQSLSHGIDRLRDKLADSGKIVRLVGLSGVGKTRFAQCLFDARIASRPLPSSLAVYTNLSDDPDPQPTGLASDLIANRTRAVLIVDNCPPDLHRRLTDLCSGRHSTISVLTIEYDVRDDQPEGTLVVTLETSSVELIEKLVRRRYANLSQVDAGTIADASGGNARIAIALAETVEHSDSIAGLSNDELFQRLFRQRYDPDNALLLAAQACSLLYSFQGEILDGSEAELPRLAALIGQAPAEIYRHVGELFRRDLVQQRGNWRAVLPHAIANRLAARALDGIPYNYIDQHFITGGTERLARSFSRRLSFLHDHPKAINIVEKWLAPSGLLGNLNVLNDLGRAMFTNVASVLPETTLVCMERAEDGHLGADSMMWRQHLPLLRSLAYDQALFERCVKLLEMVATNSSNELEAKQATEIFVSLFSLHLSGTHATIEQRLSVIEQLLGSTNVRTRALGLAALDKVLQTGHFSSSYGFEFGARSRGYGYCPANRSDVTQWYSSALLLIERLALTDGVLEHELRARLARGFRGMWASAHMHIELDRLTRGFSARGFWQEGWAACRSLMKFDMNWMASEAALLLTSLERDLRPSNLTERVRAFVLGQSSFGFDLDDFDLDDDIENQTTRLEAIARELGAAVAGDDEVLEKILPDILRGGNRAWVFGCGLASASMAPRATWMRLASGLDVLLPEQRNIQILKGFLTALWEQDKNLAHNLLDAALDQCALQAFLPELHSAVELDQRCIERLTRALNDGLVPVRMYGALAYGRTLNTLAVSPFCDLLLLVAAHAEGFEVALEVLSMRLFSNRANQRENEPEFLRAGREMLPHITFRKNNQLDDYTLAVVIKACLSDSDGGPVASQIAARFRHAVLTNETYSFDNNGLLKSLLELHPVAVLDALFEGNEANQQVGIHAFEHIGGHSSNPMDVVSTENLIAWCEGDREQRYLLASSVVTFANQSETSGPQLWSDQAKALLSNAADPKSVLAVFIKRFRPMSWSGSRSALIEANAQLLDSLEPNFPRDLKAFVDEAKVHLAKEVVEDRLWETREDRVRDERFE